jgi:hypothetical protein
MPRAAPGPRGSAPLLRGRHAPHRRRGLKPLSGQRAARPDSSPHPRRPDSASSHPLASRQCPASHAPPPPRPAVSARLCPKTPHPAVRARPSRRCCPAASAVASTTTVSVARALPSPFFVRGASSSPPLPPRHCRTTAGHRSPSLSERHRCRAGFLLMSGG